MKKLIIIFIFFTISSYSQECRYQAYYKLVATAKKQSDNKHYKLANSNFKKAFLKVDFPLGRDLGNALLVARKSKDDFWAQEISIKLAKGGVPIKYFTKLYKMSWYKDFKKNFKQYSLFYKNNFNQVLKDKWIDLILNDRHFNIERYHAHREGTIKITLEVLIAEASKISKQLINIVENYGFPHESQMGYLYIQGQNSIIDYRIGVVLRHIYQRGELVYQEDIDNYICDGKLREKDVVSQKSIGFWYGIGLENAMKKFYNRYSKI